jgi:polysaccharide deacetylase family protein (PEP-CTERM system associated)
MQRLALTIDVEDYYHTTAFEEVVPRPAWHAMESRIEANTQNVLGILADCGVTGTFFVLGWIAEKHPEIVRAIGEAGHEVASHGYDHHLVYRQTPEEFRADIRRAKKILEDVLGKPILGYRAPTFSITRRSQWAHRILAEEGYVYSSSVFPVRHDRYGWPEFGGRPKNIDVGDGLSIWEFPLPFLELGKVLIPFGGGGYLRIYPFWMTKALLKMGIRNKENTTVLYFHPWEIDPGQPRLPLHPVSRLRHYWGLDSTEKRIRKLLGTFPVEPIARQLASSRAFYGGKGPCAA